jgi:hypothetical protein
VIFQVTSTNLPSTADYNCEFQVRSIASILFASSFAKCIISLETNGSYPKRVLILGRLNLQVLQPLGTPFSFSLSCCSHFGTGHPWNSLFHFSFLILGQSVRLLGREISPSQGRYLHRTTQTQNKRRQKSMPWVRFKPTIPAFEGAKTIHVLNHATKVIGQPLYYFPDHWLKGKAIPVTGRGGP